MELRCLGRNRQCCCHRLRTDMLSNLLMWRHGLGNEGVENFQDQEQNCANPSPASNGELLWKGIIDWWRVKTLTSLFVRFTIISLSNSKQLNRCFLGQNLRKWGSKRLQSGGSPKHQLWVIVNDGIWEEQKTPSFHSILASGRLLAILRRTPCVSDAFLSKFFLALFEF